MLHQSYLTPVRLQAMQRIPTSACTRCTHQQADFTHVMWLCPGIDRCWQQVVATLSTILSVPVPCHPQICFLGILDEEQWPKYTKILLWETLFLACKPITLKWNQSAPPSIHQWIRMGNQILSYEKLILEHRGCLGKYGKVCDVCCSSTLTIVDT